MSQKGVKLENISINQIEKYKLEQDVFNLRHFQSTIIKYIKNLYDKIISKLGCKL